MIWTRNTGVFVLGDSITDGQPNCITPWGPTFKGVSALFGPPVVPTPYAPFVPPRQARPVARGYSGNPTKACDTLAPDVATITALLRGYAGPFTNACVELGINDSSRVQAGTITPTQMSDAQNRILDALASVMGIPGSAVLWVGPWATAAYLATSTNTVEPLLRANVVARGGQYVSWLGVAMTEPGGADRTLGDNVHPNALGAAALSIPLLAAIQAG